MQFTLICTTGTPTSVASHTLEQFEQMPNAAKADHILRFPIEDLFMPVLDTDFCNGMQAGNIEAERHRAVTPGHLTTE